MVKRIIALALLTLAIFPFTANAQEDVALNQLTVDLWPEYDRPTVLIIYHATLSPADSLPAELTFRIPASAGDPHAVAVRQVDGSLLNATFERQVSGEWGLITITATTPEIQFEYYDPDLQIQGDQRHFEFHWPGDYAVDSFIVQVQQPVSVATMRFSPNLGSSTLGADGLTYYNSEIGSLAAGSTFTISVDYEKSSDALSAGSQQVLPSAPISNETLGRVTLREVLPWVLGALGIVLIAGGGWWYWRSGQQVSPKKSRRRKPVSEIISGSMPEGEVYCHMCGKRAESGDRFCRSCGARLRV